MSQIRAIWTHFVTICRGLSGGHGEGLQNRCRRQGGRAQTLALSRRPLPCLCWHQACGKRFHHQIPRSPFPPIPTHLHFHHAPNILFHRCPLGHVQFLLLHPRPASWDRTTRRIASWTLSVQRHRHHRQSQLRLLESRSVQIRPPAIRHTSVTRAYVTPSFRWRCPTSDRLENPIGIVRGENRIGIVRFGKFRWKIPLG